jgi:hypothetical protein
MCPSKYNTITVKVNKSYRSKTPERRNEFRKTMSSGILDTTKEKIIKNDNYNIIKYNKESDISEINYEKILPSASEINLNTNNTIGNTIYIEQTRDQRDRFPYMDSAKTNKKTNTYSSDGFSYFKSKYNYSQKNLNSDLAVTKFDKNKFIQKYDGQNLATFAENRDDNIKMINNKNHNINMESDISYNYNKNEQFDKKDNSEERKLKSQGLKSNYSNKTKNHIQENHNSFEENNEYNLLTPEGYKISNNKYFNKYSPVRRENITISQNDANININKSKNQTDKRIFRDEASVGISLIEFNKTRGKMDDKKPTRDQEILDIRERYEKKLKVPGKFISNYLTGQMNDIYDHPQSYSRREMPINKYDHFENETRNYSYPERERPSDNDQQFASSRDKTLHTYNSINKQSKNKLYNSTFHTSLSIPKPKRSFYEDKVHSSAALENRNYEKRY